MSKGRWPGVRVAAADPRAAAGLLLAAALLAVLFAAPARASLGYQLDAAHPSRALPGPPKGIAIDQATQDIYVAIVTTNPNTGALGEVDRFNSDLSADGVFAKGGGYYTGVAPDPVTGGFFGAQMEIRGTPIGNVGTPRMDRFTSAGAAAGSFAVAYSNSFPPIATDSAGHIYFPNVNTHSVQVFNSAGTLLEEITCSGCPGGSFGKPGSVALNAAGDLYVADVDPDRVVKLTSSGGAYSFSSVLQSNRGAGAVAVDPSTGDVFVGDMVGGNDFHIVAYDSSGTQFDDFAADIFPDVSGGGFGALSSYQMGVNGTTHKLYVGEINEFYVFERTMTASPPSVNAEPATNVGQLVAKLKATVNALGHAALECDFEYTDESDFQANGFSNALSLPCPENPDGTTNTSLSVNVSGLTPGGAYRFRVTATSNAGTTTSSSKTFETLPAVPPTVSTDPAQGVTQIEAKLKGTANPHGGSASDCHFEFGTSISYGSNYACALPGPVTTAVAESKSVSGLKPSTTYHYRLVVSTNAGTAKGDDVTFTTADPPVESGSEPDPTAQPPPAAPPTTTPPPPTDPGPTTHLPRCKKGFRRERIHGQARCVKICRAGFRQVRVHAKVKCVRRKHANRRRRSPGER